MQQVNYEISRAKANACDIQWLERYNFLNPVGMKERFSLY